MRVSGSAYEYSNNLACSKLENRRPTYSWPQGMIAVEADESMMATGESYEHGERWVLVGG